MTVTRTANNRRPEPPISALAEATLAAAGLMVKDFWESVSYVPDPEDFDDANLAALWAAILAVQKRSPITKMAVAVELRSMRFSEQDAFSALGAVRPEMVKLQEGLAAIDALRARKLRRQVASACSEAITELETASDVQSVVLRHEKAVSDIAAHHDDGDGWVAGVDVQGVTTERIETGLRAFDETFGGLPAGELTIMAGRPGMGKSGFAADLSRRIALAEVGCGFYSMEMQSISLLNRIAAGQAYQRGPVAAGRSANPYYETYERGDLKDDYLQRFEQALQEVRALPIFWDERRGLDMARIRLGARRLKTKYAREGRNLRLLAVDHLGKIKSDRGRRQENRNLELGEMTNALAELAGELQIAVLCLCQLNRKLEDRSDKRPTIPDLRESGQIEENAHSVILLYRPAYYDNEARDRGEKVDEDRAYDEANILEVHYAKNRSGPTKRLKLFCEIGANAFTDPPPGRVSKMAYRRAGT
jgi:replicative DNA helicase